VFPKENADECGSLKHQAVSPSPHLINQAAYTGLYLVKHLQNEANPFLPLLVSDTAMLLFLTTKPEQAA
jgi:hypothetical protein